MLCLMDSLPFGTRLDLHKDSIETRFAYNVVWHKILIYWYFYWNCLHYFVNHYGFILLGLSVR